MYEYIVTAFKVIVSIITGERLAISACIIYGCLLLWVLFSLVFSFQVKFARNCKQISMLVDGKGLNSETYPKFIELASKLPDSFLRGWKTFEHSDKGLPSQYLKRAECLDLELTGGLFNQNRSVMKTFIYSFTALLSLLSVALLGTREAITGYALAEALAMPLIFFAVSILTYFLYTAIRHRQYRICVEDFNEMVDILNEKVEYSEVEFDSRNTSSAFIRNIVEPAIENLEPVVMVSDEQNQETIEEQLTEVNLVDGAPVFEEAVNDHVSVVGEETQEQPLQEIKENLENYEKPVEIKETEEYTQNVAKENQEMENVTTAPKRGRGRPKKEKAPEGELVIKSDEEFEEVLARAEKLMRKNEEPLSQSQQKRVEKALKELVDAMKKYKEEN